jgi:hypothetical protein
MTKITGPQVLVWNRHGGTRGFGVSNETCYLHPGLNCVAQAMADKFRSEFSQDASYPWSDHGEKPSLAGNCINLNKNMVGIHESLLSIAEKRDPSTVATRESHALEHQQMTRMLRDEIKSNRRRCCLVNKFCIHAGCHDIILVINSIRHFVCSSSQR